MAKKDKKEMKNNKDKTSFMKSFKAELKKVIWPTPKQLFNNTVAVLAIVLITALIVFVLDLTFESMNKHGIDKVKQMVSNSVDDGTTATENEVSDEEETETTEVTDVNNDDTTVDNTTVDESNATENTNNE